MKKEVVQVEIKGMFPATKGCALFLGNETKVFVIDIPTSMAEVIDSFSRDLSKERPLTHDLMMSVFAGFGITLDRVIITSLKDTTYFARIILNQHNELARKIVEIDARPSDCLALATAQKRPIYVTTSLMEQVEDMSEVLERFKGKIVTPRWD